MKPCNHISFFVILSFVIIFIIIILSLFFSHRDARFLDNRPHDRQIYSALSVDEKHRMEVYLNNGRGATVAPSSTIFVYAIGDGLKYKNKSVWCVYFSYRNTSIEAKWITDDTIEIRHTDSEKVIETSIYTDELYYSGN